MKLMATRSEGANPLQLRVVQDPASPVLGEMAQVALAGPDETYRWTVAPLATLVPAAGLVLVTLPVGTFAFGSKSRTTLNPASRSAVRATAGSSLTSGMVTVAFMFPVDRAVRSAGVTEAGPEDAGEAVW
jgi:hypothetical protein